MIYSSKNLTLKIMVRIYSENIQKGDEMYYLMKTVFFTMCFCVCTCIGLIVVITSMIEKDKTDGSY